MSEPEILFAVENGLGIMTLNRPKALNSLSMGMIREMERVLPQWEKDQAVKAVVVRGAGDRAFCAGGDVAGLYREMRDDPQGTLRRDFFREEYIVNRRIYRFAKPWISLIDGIDMGGGVGLSVHGSHSVASEKFLFAMPETTIGLFPDVGGGYFLTRLPGALGTFLALTSHRLKVADALWAGIVDAYVPSAKIELVQKYVGAKSTHVVLANIGGKAWVRQKEAAQQAVTDLAGEMIELQAARDARPRPCEGLEETLMGMQHREATLVGAVDLMQSVLHAAGAVYQVRHSERLS